MSDQGGVMDEPVNYDYRVYEAHLYRRRIEILEGLGCVRLLDPTQVQDEKTGEWSDTGAYSGRCLVPIEHLTLTPVEAITIATNDIYLRQLRLTSQLAILRAVGEQHNYLDTVIKQRLAEEE